MKDQKPNKLPPQPDIANLDESEFASNQETVPVPVFWGTLKIAWTPITPVMRMFTKPADDVPTKK